MLRTNALNQSRPSANCSGTKRKWPRRSRLRPNRQGPTSWSSSAVRRLSSSCAVISRRLSRRFSAPTVSSASARAFSAISSASCGGRGYRRKVPSGKRIGETELTNALSKLAFEVWPEFPFISERLAIRDFSRLSCQRVTCTPSSPFGPFCNEYAAPIAPPLRSSHVREAASLDPRVRILPPQPASAVSTMRFPRV